MLNKTQLLHSIPNFGKKACFLANKTPTISSTLQKAGEYLLTKVQRHIHKNPLSKALKLNLSALCTLHPTALHSKRLDTSPVQASLFDEQSFFTLEVLFLTARYAIASTDRNTKLCFLRSFFKISPKELERLKEEEESIAIAFLTMSSIHKKTPEKLRERFASLVLSAALKSFENRSHPVHRFFTKDQQIQSACELLFKCNLPNDSEHLQTLLSYLDQVSHEMASKHYSNIDAEEILDTEQDEEGFDLAFTALYMTEENVKALNALPQEEREKQAMEALSVILKFIEKLGEEDAQTLLKDFCEPKGILHQYNLPDTSQSLLDILSHLDKITHTKASEDYYKK